MLIGMFGYLEEPFGVVSTKPLIFINSYGAKFMDFALFLLWDNIITM